jgi:hypothetical protein
MSSRRVPLALRITLEGLGRRPPNAILFEPGQRVGIHTIVKQVGSWAGVARWKLRCPVGHCFERSSTDIMRSLRKQRGPLSCRECRLLSISG